MTGLNKKLSLYCVFLFLNFTVLPTHLSSVVFLSSVWFDIVVFTLAVSIYISILCSLLQLRDEDEAYNGFPII